METQNIRVEKKPLVCEVMDVDEDPTFPLVTKKPKQPVVPPASAGADDKPSTSSGDKSSPVAGSGSTSQAGGEGASTAVPASGGGGGAAASAPLHSLRAGPMTLRHTIEYINRPVDEVWTDPDLQL